MAGPSFVTYVDESGDEGFLFKGLGRGSSVWFVLSAVVTRKHRDLPTVRLVDEMREVLGRTHHSPLHFRRLKHHQRLPYLQRIARARLRAVTVLIHKPSIRQPELFGERYRLYFYAARLLLERVSWLCRDHSHRDDSGDGSTQLFFSNRAGMSYEEMRVYLDKLQRRSRTGEDIRIDWSVVRPDQLRAVAHESLLTVRGPGGPSRRASRPGRPRRRRSRRARPGG
ncbi:MAG: DUF3800 domain-containing protein [Planctomycetota bacterium]